MSAAKPSTRKAMKQLQENASLKKNLKGKKITKKMIEKLIEKNENIKKKEKKEEKEWITNDNVNSEDKFKYWKELAQEREVVWEEMLKENLQLKEKVETLEDKIDLMKAEIQHLQKLAEEGIKLATVLEECGLEIKTSE